MLHDLDKTLKTLLEDTLPEIGPGKKLSISFEAPDDSFPPPSVQLPTVNMFLYDIRENKELRSNEYEMKTDESGRMMKLQSPVRIDCSYIVTAWTTEKDNQNNTVVDYIADEHKYLGMVMRTLLKFPVIPEDKLKGTLLGQPLPLPVGILHTGRLQNMSEFWQALGGKPKAAFNYTVTIGVDIRDPEDYGVPVKEPVLHMNLRDIIKQ